MRKEHMMRKGLGTRREKTRATNGSKAKSKESGTIIRRLKDRAKRKRNQDGMTQRLKLPNGTHPKVLQDPSKKMPREDGENPYPNISSCEKT